MNQEIPRRIRLDLVTPEELAIYNLVGEIEKLGTHPLLTDCVTLLGEARSKLADWVDLQEAEAKSEAFARVIKMVGNSTNEAAEQVRAADGSWVCHECSKLNIFDVDYCTGCETRRR